MPVCRHCGQELTWESRRWISALSGDEGGTYDICLDDPSAFGRHEIEAPPERGILR